MNDIKALILCNNPIAVPGIKEFLFYGKVSAIGIPKKNREMQYILQQLLAGTPVPLLLFTKKEFNEQVKNALHTYTPTVCLMMTFPFIISPEVLQMAPKGFINFHYGLLPQCRGPQPILNHLLNNDMEGGVTVHKVDEGIDTGAIILQERIGIEHDDTYGTLQSRLAFLAAKLAANLLKILSYGSIIPAVAQDESKAAYHAMPGAKALTINWQEMNAEKIVRLVNACNPWNKGAGTAINNWGIGITEAEIIGECETSDTAPGKILHCNEEAGLVVSTIDNQKLKINIVYTNEGFFSGSRLAAFQIKSGDSFM